MSASKSAGGYSVQDLQAHQPNFVIGYREQCGANRQRPKSNQQKGLAPPTIRLPSDQQSDGYCDDLSGDDAGRDECALCAWMSKRQFLSEQGKHGCISEMEQRICCREDQ